MNVNEKKIAVIIEKPHSGGVEKVACNICDYLKRRGYDIKLITLRNNEFSTHLSEGIEEVHLSDKLFGKEPKRFWGRLINLIKYLRKEKVDCCIAMHTITLISILAFKPLIKSKIIVSERSDPGQASFKTALLLKALSSRADCFVFQTQGARAWYGNHVRDEKAVIIPNSVNTDFLKHSLSFCSSREKRIVAVGRLSSQKNYPLMIDAFNAAKGKIPEYKLHIYGDGNMLEELQKKVLAMDLQNRVIFEGFSTDIPEKIINASAFVLSSNFEGMPNALIEAMALGIPSIATDCPTGGPAFLIKNMDNGILVPVNDVEKLSNAIVLVCSDLDLANKISQNALKIREELKPDVIYDKWEECIKKVITE